MDDRGSRVCFPGFKIRRSSGDGQEAICTGSDPSKTRRQPGLQPRTVDANRTL